MKLPDLIAVIAIAIIALSIWRAHRDPEFDGFNVFDLLMENGKLDPAKCIAMGSWFMALWVMWRLTVEGKMTDGFFTAFLAACFAPAIAKMFAPKKE